MNVKECYEQFGGDFEGVVGRLGKEERVSKYARMFAAGNDYQLIEESLQANQKEDAFRNVHNLKGVALNLGLTPVQKTADVLCEALRPGNPPVSDEDIAKMLEEVKTAYDGVISALGELD